ncbi:hypothetical protein [Arthrobacter sp. UYCu723]
MTPSIGRIVHYHSYGTPGGEYLPEPRAAIITAVELVAEEPGTYVASLCVLNPTGMFFNEGVEFSETPAPGHWTWPPRA